MVVCYQFSGTVCTNVFVSTFDISGNLVMNNSVPANCEENLCDNKINLVDLTPGMLYNLDIFACYGTICGDIYQDLYETTSKITLI